MNINKPELNVLYKTKGFNNTFFIQLICINNFNTNFN